MGDALMHGQRFRTFNVLDDFSREVLAVEVDTNLPDGLYNTGWIFQGISEHLT